MQQQVLPPPDEQDIVDLYDRYASALYTFIYKIVGEKATSEKVLEKTFINFSNHHKHTSAVSQHFSILINTSRSLAIESLIDLHTKQVRLIREMGLFCSTPIVNYIEKLDPLEKAIFSLTYFRGLKFEQVSELLKIRVELLKLKVKGAYEKLHIISPKREVIFTSTNAGANIA